MNRKGNKVLDDSVQPLVDIYMLKDKPALAYRPLDLLEPRPNRDNDPP